MTEITDKLLNCAVQKIPRLTKSWMLVKNCAKSVQVYHIPKANVPFLKVSTTISVPLAFVTPKIFENDIFAVNSEYNTLSNTTKALVVIHECTHLVLDTVDHAYVWESEFDTLNSKKHLENADSYVEILLNNCINDTYVF